MLELAKVQDIHYEKSESITTQGSRKSIKPLLDSGYYVKEERYGFWVLYKPVRVIITLRSYNGTKSYSFNIKQDICNIYGKKRISEQIYYDFIDDMERERFIFKIDETTNYCEILY